MHFYKDAEGKQHLFFSEKGYAIIKFPKFPIFVYKCK